VYEVKKNTQVKLHVQLYVYLFIRYSVYVILCCLRAGQILPMLPRPHKRLSGPSLKVFSVLAITETVHVVCDAKAWFMLPQRFRMLLLVAHKVKLSVCRKAWTLTACGWSLIVMLRTCSSGWCLEATPARIVCTVTLYRGTEGPRIYVMGNACSTCKDDLKMLALVSLCNICCTFCCRQLQSSLELLAWTFS
jgi:hypothetical protein